MYGEIMREETSADIWHGSVFLVALSLGQTKSSGHTALLIDLIDRPYRDWMCETLNMPRKVPGKLIRVYMLLLLINIATRNVLLNHIILLWI